MRPFAANTAATCCESDAHLRSARNRLIRVGSWRVVLLFRSVYSHYHFASWAKVCCPRYVPCHILMDTFIRHKGSQHKIEKTDRQTNRQTRPVYRNYRRENRERKNSYKRDKAILAILMLCRAKKHRHASYCCVACNFRLHVGTSRVRCRLPIREARRYECL